MRSTILVLGDLPSSWERTLTDEHRVVHTFEQTACLRMAEADRPEAILVGDHEGDAGVLLDILSRDDATSAIPVFLLSDDAEPQERMIALERGAFEMVSDQIEPADLLARISDVLSSTQRLRRLKESGDLDHGSGLPGRRAMLDRIAEETRRLGASSRRFSMIVIEPDRHAALVAESGAEAGRQMSAQLARGLEAATRSSDGTFKDSGSRFSVVLPDTDLDAALTVANRTRELFSAYGYDEGPTMTLDRTEGGWTSSAGVIEVDEQAPAEEIAARATAAMKRAQSMGGDTIWKEAQGAGEADPAYETESLTMREWTVLAHLARGRSEKQIAEQLGIRSGTVRSHKARIRRKLNISPLLRLAEWAKDNVRALARRDGLDLDRLAGG